MELVKTEPCIGGNLLRRQGYKYWQEVYCHGRSYSLYSSLPLQLLNTADLHTDGKWNVGSKYFDATEDIDNLYEIGEGGYITIQEHNPIVNVKRMFDHLRNKKLERYRNEDEYPLEDFPYDFYGNLDNLEKVLEDNYFLHSKFDDPNFEPTQEDLDKPYGSGSYEEYMEWHENQD